MSVADEYWEQTESCRSRTSRLWRVRLVPKAESLLRAESPHLITSLARKSIACENSRPSNFVVLRLITNSKIVGRSMGRSLGVAPRAIRLT
jgi:hypothetical protein